MIVDTIFLALTVICIILILYHHVGYPMILKKARSLPSDKAKAHLNKCSTTIDLPSITLIIPAFQEESFIAQKIYNLTTLDYPKEKLKVLIYCDGCNDKTHQYAMEATASILCETLNIEVKNVEKNRGKVCSLNRIIPHVTSDIVALSDVSALLSMDSLLIAAQHFQEGNIGVVAGTYDFLTPGSNGEDTYWQYQRNIKKGECSLGGPIGAHGAFYAFRARLFSRLKENIVNDDFIIPMDIIAKGYRAVYEPDIMALELEKSDLNMDFKRRCRIAQGNVQQAFHLKHLLHPKYKGVAFSFASGKVLRAFMPLLMVFALLGSLFLSMNENQYVSLLFSAGALLQILGYGFALLPSIFSQTVFPKIVYTLNYLVVGYAAGLLGVIVYLKQYYRKENTPWARVKTSS